MSKSEKIKALLTRRNLLIGAAGTAGAVVLTAPKSDMSGPRGEYYLNLQNALKTDGVGTPTLIIDVDRLNYNIDTLMSSLPEGMAYRIVAKSLPSQGLVSYIAERTGSTRVMTFNLSMLDEISKNMPQVDQLLGKPLPIAAAKKYLQSDQFTAAERSNVQWLIDSPERLRDYAAVANTQNEALRVNIEIDVGLHRGGVTPGTGLEEMLTMIKSDPNLTFSGYMGYEPHIGGMSSAGGKQQRALKGAWDIYQASLDAASEMLGSDALIGATRNAAGSNTFHLYKDTNIANEVAVGTALVKPNKYDLSSLSDFQAASFISTPVIKSFEETRIAGAPAWRDSLRRAFNPNLDHTIFVYGGKWMADPIDPPGLQYNTVSPRSSNQDMLNGGTRLNIARNDFVFLRPHQSEAVFLQFGDIALYKDGKIIDYWPVFPVEA